MKEDNNQNLDLTDLDFKKIFSFHELFNQELKKLGESFAGLTIQEIENKLDGIDHLLKNIIGIIHVPEFPEIEITIQDEKVKPKVKKHFINASSGN